MACFYLMGSPQSICKCCNGRGGEEVHRDWRGGEEVHRDGRGGEEVHRDGRGGGA